MSSSRALRSIISRAPGWAAREAVTRSQGFASACSASWRASAVRERGLERRSLHVSQCICKSKRSFAKSVEDSGGWENEDGGADVPVMRTKGKGKAAKSSGTKGGAKSRRGDKEAEALEDDNNYKTSTKNDELPGEAFDAKKLTENMQRSVERCRNVVSQKVGMIGRADPSILDSVKVTLSKDSSETLPLRELATVGVRSGALYIHAFDPSHVKEIEKAIYLSQLDLTPQIAPGDEEGVLRVPLPKITVESRRDLIKEISKLCENARVSIRSARHIAQKQIKSDIDNKVVGSSEGKQEMKKMEDTTKKFSTEVDELFEQMKSKIEASMN